MGGFFGWFLVFIGVLAIFNAEKLPAIKQMLEEKFKSSVDAAKEGSKLAQAKLQQVKTDIENKKKSSTAAAESEENSPEEIDEALKFMNNYVKENKHEELPNPSNSEIKVESVPEEKKDDTSAEDAPIDLEHRD